MAEQSALDVIIRGKDELSPHLNQLESKLIRFVGAVSSAIASIKLAAFPITAAGDFEREMANVGKTTNFTRTQVAELGSELLKLSLRVDVSALDLAKIASAAGQQGLGTEGIKGVLQFTDSVSRMASVLDITAEQAGSDIGKILNIFKIPIDQIENVISSVNQVTNNAPAQGKQMLDIIKRIGDAAAVSDNKVGSFTNTVALAATGLELGISPEVIGTSFTKILAQFQTKAEKFAAVMGMSTKDWSDMVAKDGVKALQAYNKVLRQMDRVSQAQTISDLEGQGRVFGLASKLTRDTLDASLSKNLGNAQKGFADGLSALKEQGRVLDTFNSQVKLLTNSFFKLGEEAGAPLLGPLAKQVNELNTALQTPAVKSFVGALVGGIGDLIQMVVRGVKAVSEWNVNWNNLITLAKVFIGLKLVDTIGNIALRAGAGLPGLRSLLNMVAKEYVVTGQAAQNGSNAANAANAQQITGMQLLKKSIAEVSAARRAAAEADAAAAAAQAAAAKSQSQALAANTVAGITSNRAANARQALVPVAAAITTAQNSGQAGVAAAQAALNQRVQAAENAHQARIAAIRAQWAGIRTNAGKAQRDAELLAEDVFHTRSLAGIQGYHARQIAAAQAAAQAQIAQAQAAAAAQLQIATTTQAAADAAALRAARVQAVANGRAAQAAAAAAASQAASSAVGIAAAASFTFTRVAAVIAGGVRMILAALGPLMLIATTVYMILDATGKLDGAWGWLKNLSDSLGLTSKAQRELNDANRIALELSEKKKKAIAEEIQAYEDLLDASGRINKQDLENQNTALRTETSEKQIVKKTGDVFSQASASLRTKEHAEQVVTEAPINDNAARQKMATIEAQIAKVKAEIAALPAQQARAIRLYEDSVEGVTAKIGVMRNALQTNLDALNTEYGKVLKTVNDSIVVGADGLRANAKLSQDNAQAELNRVAKLFTAESVLQLERVKNIQKLKADLDEANKAIKELPAVVHTGNREEDKKADDKFKADLQERTTARNNIEAQLKLAKTALNDFIESQKKMPGVPDAVIKSYLFLQSLINLTKADFDRGVEAVEAIQKQQAAGNKDAPKFTGELVPTILPAPPDTGTKRGPVTAKEESLASKIAKAKFALLKAQLQAQHDLEREANDQLLALDQRAYDLGLQAATEFYQNRQKIQMDNNKLDIERTKKEIEGLKLERAGIVGKDREPDRIRVDAQIATANGQLAILKKKQDGIRAQTEADITKANQAFTDSLASSQVDLAKQLGTDDLTTFFDATLKNYQNQYREFLKRLESEAAAHPELKETISKLIADTKLSAVLKTTADAFAEISAQADVAAAAFDRYGRKVALLQRMGQITDRDAVQMLNREREKAIAAAKAQVLSLEAAIAKLDSKDPKVLQSKPYIDLAAQLDNARLKFEELRNTVDEVANHINKSIEDNIVNVLTKIGTTVNLKDNPRFNKDKPEDPITNPKQIAESGVKVALNELKANLGATLREVIAKDLTQSFVKNFLGGGGNEGIGGFISKMLRPKGAPEVRNKETLGTSEGNALWVEITKGSADKLGSSLQTAFGPTPDGGNLDKGNLQGPMPDGSNLDGIKKSGEDLQNTVNDLFTGLLGNTGKFVNKFIDLLSSMFSSDGNGVGGLGGLVKGFVSLFHEGGIAGEYSGMARDVSPLLFANAVRYHSGGIAGLQPGEVPAILKKGEEILTENNPRHVKNGRGGNSSGPVQLAIHPDAINMTLRDWLEGEMSRINANR